jgi:hypothetical protein
MRKIIVAALVGTFVWAAGPTGISQARAQSELDYFGTNLFAGIAYHRWACKVDGPYLNSHVMTNNTYQGFTGTQYCHQGWMWSDENAHADTYLGSTAGGKLGDDWLGYYYGDANWAYGLALTGAYAGNASDWHDYCHSWATNYANNSTADLSSRSVQGAPNACSYNVVTNCNSDCWIAHFSSAQGWTVATASPCL